MAFNVCRDRDPTFAFDACELASTYWTKMRQKRAKAYKKLMAMYELSFGFRQPYQVLGGSSAVDHTTERNEVDGDPQWMQGCV